MIVPLGGGGLASGIAIAVKAGNPSVEVIGVQVAACAPYAHRALLPPGPSSPLADGIAVKRPGEITRPLVERWLDDVVVVEENAVADAMVLLMERAKLFVEGAGAVGVAALLLATGCTPRRPGTTCVVLSGGNVDLGLLPGLIRRHETQAGRRLILFARISDRPGGLARLLGCSPSVAPTSSRSNMFAKASICMSARRACKWCSRCVVAGTPARSSTPSAPPVTPTSAPTPARRLDGWLVDLGAGDGALTAALVAAGAGSSPSSCTRRVAPARSLRRRRR